MIIKRNPIINDKIRQLELDQLAILYTVLTDSAQMIFECNGDEQTESTELLMWMADEINLFRARLYII